MGPKVHLVPVLTRIRKPGPRGCCLGCSVGLKQKVELN